MSLSSSGEKNPTAADSTMDVLSLEKCLSTRRRCLSKGGKSLKVRWFRNIGLRSRDRDVMSSDKKRSLLIVGFIKLLHYYLEKLIQKRNWGDFMNIEKDLERDA